jgi:hypothetical protein
LTGTIHQVSLLMTRITLMRFILQNGIMIHTSPTTFRMARLQFSADSFFPGPYTHVARNDCQGIECLFFTLSIIPQKFRTRSWSWCPLGIMPKFEANDSKGQNATAFHHVLSVLLRGVQEAHSLGGLITDVLGPDGLQ